MGIINAVVTGVLAAVICDAADAGVTLRTMIGAVAAVATAILLSVVGYRKVAR